MWIHTVCYVSGCVFIMDHHLHVSRKRAKTEDIIYIHNAQADVGYCKAAMHSAACGNI